MFYFYIADIIFCFFVSRFLQAEAGPWGHLSPSPRSPTRTPAISPGAGSCTSHLSPGTSPGGPSPTSPAGSASGSRAPPPRQYRGRTSSMPAVPRHKVRKFPYCYKFLFHNILESSLSQLFENGIYTLSCNIIPSLSSCVFLCLLTTK